MVWPVLPLVAEGLLRPALLASGGTMILLRLQGWAPATWPVGGVATLLSLGVLCRIRRKMLGPWTHASGRCDRGEHAARAQAAVAAAKRPGPLRMFKATTSNTFRPHQIANREQSQNRLDLSGFVHVLEVNVGELWCDIEASATFETFVSETLAVGVVPLVVPELRTITVGGAIVGIGVESSSFRHGFFHEGLLEADVLLASGEIVTAGPTGEHAELFRALPNSLGSFGYLLRLRMRVQRAQPLVRLEKVWCSSPEALIEGLSSACSRPETDFVDGVALGDQGGMVITATFVPETPAGTRAQQYGVWPQFYPTLMHEGIEYVSTLDYLWRWDADWFWCTQIFPGLTWRVIRWLCGSEILRSDVYKMFNDAVIKNVLQPLNLNKNEELVIQDIEIPLGHSAEWIRKFLSVVPSGRIGKIKLKRPGQPQTVPLWLCPVKGTASPLMPMQAGQMYVNFGFWDALEGPETQGGMQAGRINRALEQLCGAMGGRKSLYSTCYYSEEEFHEQYNGAVYRQIKERYDPDHRFRGWYERITRA